jgi:hypothetical protein
MAGNGFSFHIEVRCTGELEDRQNAPAVEAGSRKDRKGAMRSFFRHEFETRSLPPSLAATRRGFTFDIADPRSSIHGFTRNDPTIDSRLRHFVTIRVISVFLAIVACTISCGFFNAQESPRLEQSRSSLSPDNKWEYSLDDSRWPGIVKAGTTQIVVNLDQDLAVSSRDANRKREHRD